MTVIALPSGHDYLAAALLRDLGFVRVHVDEPIRRLALKIDPFVEAGVVLANMGRSPRLSSRLESNKGDWRAAQQRAPEITRILDVLRENVQPPHELDGDVVIVGVDSAKEHEYLERAFDGEVSTVAVAGRDNWHDYEPDHLIAEGPVVEQEMGIVDFARSLMGVGKPVTVAAGPSRRAAAEALLDDDDEPDPF
jgi:hypothetical protein